jgi:hypothetical protein
MRLLLKSKIFARFLFTFFAVIFASSLFYYRHSYKDYLVNSYFYAMSFIQVGYARDRDLVLPYFDEDFYRREYAADLKKCNQHPIDHFMQRSGCFFGGDFDPNPWFNMTLYKERLWPCSGNAFVDFLRQPSLKVPQEALPVEIYANQDQLYRAWMAAEAFLRRQQFKVILVLPAIFKENIPVCFQPMVQRGLKVGFSNDPSLSFYKSPFLKHPDQYLVTDLPAVETAPVDLAITRFRKKEGYEYLMHRLYNYTGWKKKGRINPCMLNFAHYCFEPVEFSGFGRDEYTFKKSMRRLAPGFDLMFINSNIGTPNLRIVPGYLFSRINLEEIPAEKKYGISFLLSLGGKGVQSFKTRGSFIYHYRKIIWDSEAKFTLPTNFYVSHRDLSKYPDDMQERALPTDSKKWIFFDQFTIAIENSKQDNYFSEKLLECFMALSVPIYIGCPNIGDYFDVRGMLIAKYPEDVLDIARNLTPETYQAMLPYLQENKRRAQELVNLEDTYIQAFFKNFFGG